MARFQKVDLSGYRISAGHVTFVSADIPSHPSPFAIVRYSRAGREEPEGLRLDLDKRAFLDEPEDLLRDGTLERAAAQVADALRESLPLARRAS